MSNPATTDTTVNPTETTAKPADPLEKSVVPDGYNIQVIKSDIGLMLNFAVNSGKELPAGINLQATSDEASLLADYNSLRKVIAPATVESIKFINSQMLLSGSTKKWYRIPIYSRCVIIAAIALVALILISLSPKVNEEAQSAGLLNASGLDLLYNLTFICAASLLGVMFYLLKTFGDKIRNYTLIPANSVELNASIIIGVISGFVISELFAYTTQSIGNQQIEIHKMTLALLGGFSSDAIFSTLQGVVNKFKQMVSA